MGPPGAGKGTIAEMLQENFDVVHLSSGDILRDAIKENNPLGMKAKAFMEKGVLVPDEIIIEIMKEKINADAFVLDGFPRNLVQVKKLEDADIKIDIVLNLQVDEHLKNMPPKKEDICDVCNGKLYQREDDKPQTIKERLNTYREQTEELVKYYDEKNILENIDAGGNKEITYDKITGLEWLKKRKYKLKAGL